MNFKQIRIRTINRVSKQAQQGQVFKTESIIPLGIVLWTSFQVYRHKMLPNKGRRRVLALFFFRLVVIFVVMWLPAVFMMFMGSAWWKNPWTDWSGGTWGHLQGAVSGVACLLKEDINKAVKDLLLCRNPEDAPKEAYKVAVQSISAVLEDGSDDGKKKDSFAHQELPDTEDAANEPTTNHPYDHSTNHDFSTVEHEDPDWIANNTGNPNAHWPSQRPKRVNPRLAQWQEDQLKQKDAEYNKKSTKSKDDVESTTSGRSSSNKSQKSTTSSRISTAKSAKSVKSVKSNATASRSSRSYPGTKLRYDNRSIARHILKGLDDEHDDPVEESDHNIIKE